MLNDLRYALRMMLKSPGYAAIVVFTLALGIGATTAIYSAVNAVLLNPIPGSQTDRLIQIGQQSTANDGQPWYGGVSPPVFEVLRAKQDSFADLAWCDQTSLDRKTEDFVEQIMGAMVSPNFFSLFGAPPALGRTFAADEGLEEDESPRPTGDSVIILSHSMWQSLFAGQRDAIGKRIELSNRHFTVIGVMPPEFRFPWGSTQFWLPSRDPRFRADLISAPNITVVTRLKPGAELAQTQAMLEVTRQQLLQAHANDKWGYGKSWQQKGWGLNLFARPLRFMFTDRNQDLRRTLLQLFAAIAFILLIVCANVANLTLARAERRQQEMAIRAALGAGRARLMQQLLIECLLLACLGGVGGLIVAAWGLRVLAWMIPIYMPRLREISLDGRALGFSLLVSVLTGLAFGLAPAWRAGRARLNEALKRTGAGTTAAPGGKKLRNSLVIAEVALTVVLMAGAGLMIQSVVRLLHVKRGFDPENLLQIYVQLPFEKYANKRELKNTALAKVHERLANLPGVSAVGIGRASDFADEYTIDGQPKPIKLDRAGTGVDASNFFRATRIPLLAGRHFEKSDIGEKIGTVIVNESMARLCWPGENALGKTFRAYKQVYQVVGVVGDARIFSLDTPPGPQFYRPYNQFDFLGGPHFFVMRTHSDPKAIIPAIRKELKAVEPAMQTPSIGVTTENLYRSTEAQRTYMLYLVSFAGAGVLLSAFGIYGVLAYSVARRTRELGIRIALGAERHHLLRMVMAQGVRLFIAGAIAGLLLAFWLTRFLRSQLFDVSPNDPLVMSAVIALLFVIAMFACFFPARRATRIDAMTALRSE